MAEIVSSSGLEFAFVSDPIDKVRDWVFNDSHHVFAVYTGGLIRDKETEFDHGPSHHNLPRIGDVLVVPAGQHVGITAHGDLAEFNQVTVPTNVLDHRELAPRFGFRDPLLHQTTKRLRSLVDRDDLLARLLKESLSDAVRLHLVEHYTEIRRPRTTRRALNRSEQLKLVEFIEDSLDSSISIAALARFAQMSTSEFTRAFIDAFETTPYQFVLTRRINRAKILLATTTLAISDIAHLAGFSNPSHLSTAFHSRIGVTPTAYRNAF